MANHLLWISLICIYLLLLINGTIFLTTINMKRKENKWRKNYKKMYDLLEPNLIAYMNRRKPPLKELFYNGNELRTDVITTLIKTNAYSTSMSESQAFEDLGYVTGVVEEAEKKITLKRIKQLGDMGSPDAFKILLKATSKDDFEIVYQSCYALSLLPMKEKEAEKYVEVLLSTNILRDRMIEMLKNLSLSLEVYWNLLKSRDTELGKVILIRAIEDRFHEANLSMMKVVTGFLKDPQSTKEIRIAAVVAMAASKNEKHLQVLINHYPEEKDWEVRAAVAKALNNYTEEISIDTIPILKQMMYDSSWWVRFNASEVLARKGEEGINALVDISLNSDDKDASDLAFSILDANPYVNKNLQNLGERNDD